MSRSAGAPPPCARRASSGPLPGTTPLRACRSGPRFVSLALLVNLDSHMLVDSLCSGLAHTPRYGCSLRMAANRLDRPLEHAARARHGGAAALTRTSILTAITQPTVPNAPE